MLLNTNKVGFTRITLPNGNKVYAPIDEDFKPIKMNINSSMEGYDRYLTMLERNNTTEDEIYQIAMEKYIGKNHSN